MYKMNRLESIKTWLGKFLPLPTIFCLAVVAYIIFSGDSTVFRSIDYDRSIDSLEHALAAERDTMLYYQNLNSRLAGDPDLMEQVVREQYGMKRASEDVFLFED